MSRVPGNKEHSTRVVFFMETFHCLFDGDFVRSCLPSIAVGKVGLTELWHMVPESWFSATTALRVKLEGVRFRITLKDAEEALMSCAVVESGEEF